MRLRIALIGMSLLLFIAVLRAQKSADDLFQQGTSLEAKGDNPGAIKIYERIVKEFASTNHTLAANATIHLARLSDVLGQDKALSYYQTILDKYSDQTRMAGEARKWIKDHTNTTKEIPTPYSKDPWSFAISPNGKSLAFLVTNGTTSSLWLRHLDTDKQGPIPGTESSIYGGGPTNVTGANPFWSPDGRFIGYFEDRKLKTISVDGGTPKTLANAPSNAGGTWNAAGDIVFMPDLTGTLSRVSAKGAEEPVQLTFLDSETSKYRYPGFFPDGRHFLMYPIPGTKIAGFVSIGSLDGGKPQILGLSVGAAALASHNRLVFASGNALHTQQLNPRTMELEGSSVLLAERVAVYSLNSGRAAFSVSDAGPVAYRKSSAARRRLLWRDALGKETSFENQAPTTSLTGTPRFSSNGEKVSFARNDYASYTNVMNSNTGAFGTVEVGYGAWSGESPIWSPDGTSFVFAFLDRNGSFRYQLFKQETSSGASGSGTRFLISGESDTPTDWRGDFLLFNRVSTGPTTNRNLMVKLVSDGSEPIPIAARAANGRFSPEGKWIVYESDEPGGSKEIFVQPFPGTAKDRLRVSNSGGTMAQWSWDGTSIYFLSQDNHLMAARFKASPNGKDPVIENPVSLFSVAASTTYAPAPDGRFLMFEPIEEMPSIFVQTNPFGMTH